MKAKFKNIVSIIAIILANTVVFSCIKEDFNEDVSDVEIDIIIEAEQFSDANVKSNSNDSIVHKERIRFKEGFAEIKVIDEGYMTHLPTSTKASASKYSILVYNSDDTYNSTIEGTINSSGKFTKNGGGSISLTPGTYKFVCVANGEISNNYESVTFSRTNNNDISNTKIALLSKVGTTDIKIGKNAVKLSMCNMQTGVRVQLTSKESNRTLPFGMQMSIEVSTSNSVTYKLINNNFSSTVTANTTQNLDWIRKIGNKESTYNYESEYMYFIESAGISAQLPYINLSFKNCTNPIFLGMDLNKTKLTLSNINNFERNKKYTIVLSMVEDKLDVPSLTEEEIYELPAWRLAPRYMTKLSDGRIVMQKDGPVTGSQEDRTGCYSWDRVEIAGSNYYKFDGDTATWTKRGLFYYPAPIIDEKTNKEYITPQTGKVGKYYMPSFSEYACFFPYHSADEPIKFNKTFEHYIKNESLKFNYNKEENLYAYDGFYWSKQINSNTNNYATHEVYGIKLFSKERAEYIKSCVYRYKWINDYSNWKNSYLEVKVIYIGMDAEIYISDKNSRDKLMEIFNKWDKGIYPENYGYKYYTELQFYATKQNYKESNTPMIQVISRDRGHGSIMIMQVSQSNLDGIVHYTHYGQCYLPVRLIRE